MIRPALLLAALSASSLALATDTYYKPVTPTYTAPVYSVPTYTVPTYTAPTYTAPKTTYDWQTGNSYTTTVNGANTTVRGFNTNTGSTWNSTIDASGNQRGTDSRGNVWQYNKATKTYINSNGRVCVGEGAARVCTGGQKPKILLSHLELFKNPAEKLNGKDAETAENPQPKKQRGEIIALYFPIPPAAFPDPDPQPNQQKTEQVIRGYQADANQERKQHDQDVHI